MPKRSKQSRQKLDKMNGYMNRVDEMGVVSVELEKLLGLENDYWKVRSKSHWLREGDRNTSYFYHHASHRRCRNTINWLKDSHGNTVTGFRDLSTIAVDYYKLLFKSG